MEHRETKTEETHFLNDRKMQAYQQHINYKWLNYLIKNQRL